MSIIRKVGIVGLSVSVSYSGMHTSGDSTRARRPYKDW